MPGSGLDDDDIDIRVRLRDELSRPAARVTRAVDKMGDEARETAREFEEMDAAQEKAAASNKKLRVETDKSTKSFHKHRKATRAASGGMGGMFGWVKRLGGGFSYLNKHVFRFNRLMMAFKWVFIIGAVAKLTNGVLALVAAFTALLTALGPIAGTLGAMPGIFAAMGQGIATAIIGFRGLGNAIKTLSDPKADPEKLAAALKDLGPNARKFAVEIAKVNRETKKRGGLFNVVQENMLVGLNKTVRDVASRYLPLLTRGLGHTATILNQNMKGFGKFLTDPKTQQSIGRIMWNNSRVLESMGRMGVHVFSMFTSLLDAAGPTLLKMTDDLTDWFDGVAKSFDKNKGGLNGFFDRSYKSFKRMMGVTRNWSRGFFNIIRQAVPLAGRLGDSIERGSVAFRKWTEKPENARKIRDWFDKMEPTIRSIASLTGDIFKFIFRAGTNADSAGIFDKIRTDLLPSLETIVGQITDTKFVDHVIDLASSMADLASTGLIGNLSSVLDTFATTATKVVDFFNSLPQVVQDALKNLALIATFVKLSGILPGVKNGLPTLPGRGGGNGALGGGGMLVYWVGAPTVTVIGGTGPGGGGVTPVPAGGPGGGKGKKPTAPKKGRMPRLRGGRAGIIAALVGGIGLSTAASASASTGGGSSSGKVDPGSAVSGLANGALLGSLAGPWGTGIGALLGLMNGASSPEGRSFWSREKQPVSRQAETNAAAFKSFFDGTGKRNVPGYGAVNGVKQIKDAGRKNQSALIQMGVRDAQVAKTNSRKSGLAVADGWSSAQSYVDRAVDKTKKSVEFKPVDLSQIGLQMLKSLVSGFGLGMPSLVTTVTNVASTVRRLFNGGTKTSATDSWLRNIPKRAEGGPTWPGQPFLVGERGPEVHVTKTGKMSVLGANGPEITRFANSGYVVPNHALTRAASSNVPTRALAAVGASGVTGYVPGAAGPSTGRPGSYESVEQNVRIGQIIAQKDVDVERAVLRALTKAEQNRRERRNGN